MMTNTDLRLNSAIGKNQDQQKQHLVNYTDEQFTSDKRAQRLMTSSSSWVYICLYVIPLIVVTCFFNYQIDKLHARIARLEDDSLARRIGKPVTSSKTVASSSFPLLFQYDFAYIPKSKVQLDYGSGILPSNGIEDIVDNDDEDGNVDFNIDYTIAKQPVTYDDVIDGSGDAVDESTLDSDSESGDFLSGRDLIPDSVNYDSLDFHPLILDLDQRKSRLRRSVDESSITQDDVINSKMADDTTTGENAPRTGRTSRLSVSQQRRVNSRSRLSSRQIQQQTALVGDVAMTSDVVNSNEGRVSGRHRPNNSKMRQNKVSRNKFSYSPGGAADNGLSSADIIRQTQNSAIKVAHFVAPHQRNRYVSDPDPPVTLPFWKVDNWTSSLDNQNQFYDLHNGMATILEAGVYMVYAQMMYHDVSGRWAFGIYVDNTERIKCMNSEQLSRQGTDVRTGSRSDDVHSVYQHCYTSGLLRLRRFDKVSLRCLYGSRSIIMQPTFTFWGLIKLVPLAD